MDAFPQTRDIVLVGGGHTHALVLRRWGMAPLAGARLTLINPDPTAPYTGMLPGFLAGHYDRDALDIDLVRLARFAGARLILGRATGIDHAAREILVEDRILGDRRIGFDAASLDVGIHSGMSDLPGFSDHAVPAKPLQTLADRWTTFHEAGDPDGGMAVIGGGVGGVELAMALSHGVRLRTGRPPRLTLIETGRVVSGLPRRGRKLLLSRMAAHDITLLEHATVASIEADGVRLGDGRWITSSFTVGAAGARPHDWLAATDLDLADGYVAVNRELRSSDPAIFATGDCAHLSHAPRPKAGVFAVRQAPVLHANLRATVSGGVTRRYHPQHSYLKLISTGERSALASKAGIALHGPLIWRWKDRIDRAFMKKFSDLKPMRTPPLPRSHALDMAALTRQAPCAGCGAKVGQTVLTDALGRQGSIRADVEQGAGDDAAILRIGETRQVVTVDQIRAFNDDPALLAHISAHHAMGDCLAMGAKPQIALSLVTLPRLSPRLEARSLREISAAAEAVFRDAGAEIAGGHTATGAELMLGFTVTGLLDAAATKLHGARPGDSLILTKPLGTGVVLAAEMALAARGADVVAAWRSMAASQLHAARILSTAHAMTDVTGFGLAGHLIGMLNASGLSADIDLGALPLLPGAADLLANGYRSTLHDANRAIRDRVTMPDTSLSDIVFDPQTAGGLLAAVPSENVDELLARLGPPSTCIGTLSAGPAQIRLT